MTIPITGKLLSLRWRSSTWVGLMLVFFSVSLPSQVEAIPAFARQFGLSCGACHEPVPPRLNTLGLTFKRMGYRLTSTTRAR